MCNDYRLRVDVETLRRGFDEAGLTIRFPDGAPNLEPRDDIRITDPAPIVRTGEESGTAEFVTRRWSWPGPRKKPVYNFRSDNREFTSGRCLIPADGFYEFTANADPKTRTKHKWLFTRADEPWFCIAGIWRTTEVGEAFTMLTTQPGRDIAPCHDRQIVVLDSADWTRWLDPQVSAKEILRPLPEGSLRVTQIDAPSAAAST